MRLATQRWRLIGGGLAANHDRASRPPPPGPGPRASKVSSHFRLSQSGQRTGNHESGLGSRERRRGIMEGGKGGLEVLCRTSTSTLDRGRFGWIDRRSSASSRIRPLQYSPPIRLRHGPDNAIDIDSKYVRSTSREGRTPSQAPSRPPERGSLPTLVAARGGRALGSKFKLQASNSKLQTSNLAKWGERREAAFVVVRPSVRRAKVLLCQDSEPRSPSWTSVAERG